MENMEENSEKIWKIQNKIVKRYGKYGRKASLIVKRYEKYGKEEGKDMEHIAENSEKIWKIQKKGKLNSEMIWKIWKKVLKTFGIYRRKISCIVKR
jgi:hypothetical protein